MKWRNNVLDINDIPDHSKFLRFAHKQLSRKLHRNNEQITRRWRTVRELPKYSQYLKLYKENKTVLINYNNNNNYIDIAELDELERQCLHCTLYTSLLNIYRMSFLSGTTNEHFSNLFNALITDSFSEIEAQNMRQVLFDGKYFVVREKIMYSRLSRYDLPATLYKIHH